MLKYAERFEMWRAREPEDGDDGDDGALRLSVCVRTSNFPAVSRLPTAAECFFDLFCFFFSENKRGIKSRKIHPLANHGFVCHPSVLLYEQTAAIYSSDFPFNPVS